MEVKIAMLFLPSCFCLNFPENMFNSVIYFLLCAITWSDYAYVMSKYNGPIILLFFFFFFFFFFFLNTQIQMGTKTHVCEQRNSGLIFMYFLNIVIGLLNYYWQKFKKIQMNRNVKKRTSDVRSRGLIRNLLDSQWCSFIMRTRKTLIRLRRLIWVFVGCTYEKVRFQTLRLNCIRVKQKEDKSIYANSEGLDQLLIRAVWPRFFSLFHRLI